MVADKTRQMLNLGLAIAQPIVAYLTNAGVTGPPIGIISNQYPTYVVPAGYAFSIWSLIFLLSFGYGVWQAIPAQRTHSLLRQIGWGTASALTATSAWMLVFQRSLFLVSLGVMLWLLLSLIFIVARLYMWMQKQSQPLSRWENILVYGTFSTFLGWITVATVANIAQVLTAYGWSGFGLSLESWGIVAMILVGIVACLVTLALAGNRPYALTLIWALIAVAVNQFSAAVPTHSIWVGGLAVAVCVVIGLVTLFRPRAKLSPQSVSY